MPMIWFPRAKSQYEWHHTVLWHISQSKWLQARIYQPSTTTLSSLYAYFSCSCSLNDGYDVRDLPIPTLWACRAVGAVTDMTQNCMNQSKCVYWIQLTSEQIQELCDVMASKLSGHNTDMENGKNIKICMGNTLEPHIWKIQTCRENV